jgi:hypothetical protein
MGSAARASERPKGEPTLAGSKISVFSAPVTPRSPDELFALYLNQMAMKVMSAKAQRHKYI